MKLPARVGDLLLWPVFAAVLFGPVLVGVFDVIPAAIFSGLLLVLCLYAFGPLNKRALPRRVGVVALSVCLATTVFDLGARAYWHYVLDDRPKELFMHPWPPLPQVLRYEPGVRFEGELYGELAGMSGQRE